MKFYSTNKNSPLVDFREATLKGQAPDKGLYFPERIPDFSKSVAACIHDLSNGEIAYRIIREYVGPCIPELELREIIKETLSFSMPLVKIDEKTFSLELFHGPTMAFKDVGARFMSRCLGYFVRNGMTGSNNQKIIVLVATSGDTGGAVASGFSGIYGVDVVILYPSGRVSPVQEMQLTTHGDNIHALELKGSFDDCQELVKKAFADSMLRKNIFLTSANSINVARWLPQQFYYFFALKQWEDGKSIPVVSVPSGNFGNICAGLLADRSAHFIDHFIAACNINDTIPEYMSTGEYHARPSIPTLSNAMDVGDPSNFVRILELFNNDIESLRAKMICYSISDGETIDAIRNVYDKNHYVLDPHGAVGWLSLQKWFENHGATKGIFLETAHPVKFPGSAKNIVAKMPASISELVNKKKKSQQIEKDYDGFKDWLIAKFA